MMLQKGFLNILVGIIIAVTILGISGYVFISRQGGLLDSRQVFSKYTPVRKRIAESRQRWLVVKLGLFWYYFSMDLSQSQKQGIEKIVEKYQLKLVLLFGSQAVGRTHRESDVDIAYLPERPLDFEKEYNLNYEFTNVFQKDRLDTVDITKAPPLLLYAIFRHPQVLFLENELIFPAYQTYAFKKYVETKPLYEERFRRQREQVSQQQT